MDGEGQDDGAPGADLGSVSAAGSVSPGSAVPRAWLCLSEMAMSPAIFELRLNARTYRPLLGSARMWTLSKEPGYFRWDESAFIR